MADILSWLIRFLHILAGVTMVGGVFLWSMVIMPNVQRRLPPPIRGAFLSVMFPRVSRYLTLAGFLVIVSGFLLMGDIHGYDVMMDVFKASETGRALGGGVVLTVAMMAIAMGVIQPSAKRLLELAPKPPAQAPAVAVAPAAGGQAAMVAPAAAAAQAPTPSPEVVALQKRLAIASIVNVLLATLVLMAMAWAVAARGL